MYCINESKLGCFSIYAILSSPGMTPGPAARHKKTAYAAAAITALIPPKNDHPPN